MFALVLWLHTDNDKKEMVVVFPFKMLRCLQTDGDDKVFSDAERDLVEALWRKPLNEAYEAGAVEEFGAGTPPDAWVGSQLKPHLPILMHLLFQPHELAKSCWSPTIQSPIRLSKNGIYHMSQLESMNWSVSPKIAQLCIYFCFCPLFNVSICVCLCVIVSVLACVSVCVCLSLCVSLYGTLLMWGPQPGDKWVATRSDNGFVEYTLSTPQRASTNPALSDFDFTETRGLCLGWSGRAGNKP